MAKREKKGTSGIVRQTFIAFLLIFSLPVLLSIVVSHLMISSQTMENANVSYRKTLEQTASYLSYKATSIRNIVDIISYDSTIQSVVNTSESYYRNNIGNWIIHTADVKNIIFNTYSTEDITTIHFYMKEGPASIEETSEFQKLSSAEKSAWYERLDGEGIFASMWFPSDFFAGHYSAPHIAFIKRIPSLNVVNKSIGIIKADIPQSVFSQILDQSSFTENSLLRLSNSRNEIIATWGQGNEDAFSEYGEMEKSILLEVERENGRYLYGHVDIDNTDWTLAVLIPVKDILAQANQMRNQILLIMMLLALISIPIMYYVSRQYTFRIRHLAEVIRNYAHRSNPIIPQTEGHDEIAMLSRDFTQMMHDVDELIQQKYIQGQKIKNLELRVLQAQINPHFLYNTLAMIQYMAMRVHADDIVKAVKDMAQFYRLSLGKGEQQVMLSQEIQHIESYIRLQNMRFGNKIQVEIDVPTELLSCYVIKILLQPLVENSIIHGILEKEEEKGTITISAKGEGDDMLIEVKDDGVGMTAEQTANILETHAKHGGFGVRNVHQRIQYIYGDSYGLKCVSFPGKGTTMILRVPCSNKVIQEAEIVG